jgi:predicted glycogen debranching enzyme
MVLLSKLEETLIIDGQAYELSTNQYPGAIHPQGHVRLKEFRLDPFPIFVYEVGDVQIEKSVFMVYGQDTTVIQYRLLGGVKDCRLEVRPLIAFRDYHATTHENSALNPRIEVETGNVKITPYVGLPSLYLAHCGEIRQTGVWYRNFEYKIERVRGLDYYEDLFNPLGIGLDLRHTRMIRDCFYSAEAN